MTVSIPISKKVYDVFPAKSSRSFKNLVLLLNRIPFATLVATAVYFVGLDWARNGYMEILEFLSVPSGFRSKSHDFVLKELSFFVAMLGLLTTLLAITATGKTRNSCYRSWGRRIAGRFFSGVLIVLSLLSVVVWICVFAVMVLAIFVVCLTKVGNYCEGFDTPEDVYIRRFMSDKSFGRFDCDRSTEVMLSLCSIGAGSILLIFGLVCQLMSLAANYARIKDQGKVSAKNHKFGQNQEQKQITLGEALERYNGVFIV